MFHTDHVLQCQQEDLRENSNSGLLLVFCCCLLCWSFSLTDCITFIVLASLCMIWDRLRCLWAVQFWLVSVSTAASWYWLLVTIDVRGRLLLLFAFQKVPQSICIGLSEMRLSPSHSRLSFFWILKGVWAALRTFHWHKYKYSIS